MINQRSFCRRHHFEPYLLNGIKGGGQEEWRDGRELKGNLSLPCLQPFSGPFLSHWKPESLQWSADTVSHLHHASMTLPSFSCSPLDGSSHVGLLAISWIHLACSCLRAFAQAVVPARTALPEPRSPFAFTHSPPSNLCSDGFLFEVAVYNTAPCLLPGFPILFSCSFPFFPPKHFNL